MEKSKHKLKKELKRAERHKDWLRKNLPNTKIKKENQKQIFKLRTAIQFDLLPLIFASAFSICSIINSTIISEPSALG